MSSLSKLKSLGFFLIFLFLWNLSPINAQNLATPQSLSFENYLKIVLEKNPLAKAARLKDLEAKAVKLKAQGLFDPYLGSEYNSKDFDNKLYYRRFSAELGYPTPLGIDLKAGYENTDGLFLNPEYSTDTYGLWFLGMEINLLQGLITDENRLALQQAKIYQDLAFVERQLLEAEILYQASLVYLDWWESSSIVKIRQENTDLANTYFTNTRSSFEQGEKTAMDTLEAYLLLQDRRNEYLESSALQTISTQNLYTFMGMNARDISDGFSSTDSTLQWSIVALPRDSQQIETLPQIRQNTLRQSMLEREMDLKRQKLFPKLKLKYNPLLSTSNESLEPIYSSSNYKIGISFSFPLLLRSERGDLLATEVKQRNLDLKTQNKRNEITNKLEALLNQIKLLQEQIVITEKNVEGYERLLEGENQKFLLGESSVFLLNKRQEKLIMSEIKLINLQVKLQKTNLSYLMLLSDFSQVLGNL